MADKETNVQILANAGVIDISEMTEEQHRVLNEELTEEEINALIKTRDLLKPAYAIKPSEGDYFF